MKPISKKKLSKKERELKVLFGLIDQYIESCQAVGSKTLMETSFHDLSSATIRNYFASLESTGFLSQQHASGGRIPTQKGFQLYAKEYLRAGTLSEEKDQALKALSSEETKEVGLYLQNATELLSNLTNLPVFISSPRFDNDFISGIKLVMIDDARCLCIIITELGLINTEIIYLDEKMHMHALKRIEEVLLSRIKAQGKDFGLSKIEEKLAQKIYNEVMVRYIIGYANFSFEDLYKTGLSKLLMHAEFKTPESIASALSLFENEKHLLDIVHASVKDTNLKCYIGDELTRFNPVTKDCTVLALPYTIAGKVVGVVGILGPMRMPYRSLFAELRAFNEYISTALTQSLSKYQLSYRTPQEGVLYLDSPSSVSPRLIENQSDES